MTTLRPASSVLNVEAKYYREALLHTYWLHNTGSSKKMDGIWNRCNLKKYYTDLHVWHLKMFRKVYSFRLTLVHFNMCTVCSSGDVQTKFYLLPRFLNHVSCYSFNGWCDPFLQVLHIPYLLSINNILNVPPTGKNQVERDLFQSHPLHSTCTWLTTGVNIAAASQGYPLTVPVSMTSASAV